MDLNDSDEQRAWGVLFALALSEKQTIWGRVNLNKTLALLQRDGFPIKNRFINWRIAPYDWHIHKDAENLERENMVVIDEKPTKYDKPMDVYRLKEEGFREVQKKYSARIECLPYKTLIKAKVEEIRRQFSTYTTPEIVDRVHHDLLMDVSQEEAERTIRLLANRLSECLETTEKGRDMTCFVCLNLLGSLEFAAKSLELSARKANGTDESSKNLIYFNAKEILHWAGKLIGHQHTRYCESHEGPSPGLREALSYRLYCTEEICNLYQVVKPIRDEHTLMEYLDKVLV